MSKPQSTFCPNNINGNPIIPGKPGNSIPKILFLDNFKLDFDNPMSTLYINKCKKIRQSLNVKTIDITDKKSVKEAVTTGYDVILMGQRCPEFYKCNKKFCAVIKENLELILGKPAIQTSDTSEGTSASLGSTPGPINASGTAPRTTKRFLLLQDTHPKTYGSLDNLTKFINSYQFNLIFTFYENSESRFIRKLCPGVKHFHLPHHIDTNIFKPISGQTSQQVEERPYDIILYGDIHPTHYPFRKRLFELILKEEAENHILKVLHITPPLGPTGKIFDPDKCEAGLAAKLNTAKFAIATKSKYDYLVAKYLEIAACQTVVIGDMATDGLINKEFRENYIPIDNKMSDEEILRTIYESIKNYDTHKIVKNRVTYSKFLLDNYNLDKYQEKLMAILSCPI